MEYVKPFENYFSFFYKIGHFEKVVFRHVWGTTGMACKQELLDSCLHAIPVVLKEESFLYHHRIASLRQILS